MQNHCQSLLSEAQPCLQSCFIKFGYYKKKWKCIEKRKNHPPPPQPPAEVTQSNIRRMTNHFLHTLEVAV